MRLSRKDLLASLVMLAVVVPFVGYSIRGSMPFVEDPRGMAAVALAGALALVWVQWRDTLARGTDGALAPMLATATVGTAVVAFAIETSWALLVPAVAGVVGLWALGLVGARRFHGGSSW
ncbi:MAG TPA: hypothetical protein VNQ77_05025 [Frankiaceae bacterium]|nr:hypothetical protein [Frankiaceae bacterium]